MSCLHVRVAGSALVLLSLTLTPVAASAQDSMAAATALYGSAAYDDALAMLDRLPSAELDVPARVAVDHYRMLCLLALGRNAEAEQAIARLLELHPSYTIGEDVASPRVVRVFVEARRKALPGVVQQRYADAQRLQNDGDHAGALTAFAVVRTLLADADIVAADPALGDLAVRLTRAEAASRESLAAPARATADAAPSGSQNAEPAAVTAATPVEPAPAPATAHAAPMAPAAPPPADGVYGVADRGVVPPVAIRQELRRWFGPVPPPPAGTPLGQVAFVVDESGAVTQLAVVSSVSAFYDAIVMDSVRAWRYQPATKDGQPVKFRRVLMIQSR